MELEKKILKMYENKNLSVKGQRIVDILKVLLVDNETDLEKITFKAGTTVKTIEKYIEEKEAIMEFLNEQEFLMLKDRFDLIKKINKKNKNKGESISSKESHKQDELVYIKKIINDIFQTRYKIKTICELNYLPVEKVKKLFYETNFLEENFGTGMKQRVKAKIAENGLRHEQIPSDKFLIEDRWDIFVTKPEVLFVNEYDYKKIRFASNYLCSGADMNYVVKKCDSSVPAVLSILSDLKLKELLKPVYYETLKKYINIEKILINNELSAKRTLLINIVHVLDKNNYNLDLVLTYFDLPINLFKKVLEEILIMPNFEEETKSKIKSLLNLEEEKKVK